MPRRPWWAAIGVGSLLSLFAAERMVRRPGPLSILLRLSLTFPGEAPSRFRVARQTGRVRELQDPGLLDSRGLAPVRWGPMEHEQPAAGVAEAASAARRTVFRWTSVALGAFIGVMSFAFIALVSSWFVGGERDIHRVHDLGWGALGGLLVALPMILQGWRPESGGALQQQILIASVALVAASALGNFNPATPIALVVAGLLWWLHPQRRAVLARGGGLEPMIASIAVLAAAPLVAYALGQAEISRACPPGGIEPHCQELHWTMMAALALALPVAGLAASLRAPGWRIATRTAGAAGLVFAAASLVFPDRASAVESGWAVAGLIAAVVFLAVAEWRGRTVSPPSGSRPTSTSPGP